ncbi:hypothetical protein HMI56_003484 [Coelomomyces lativittatus]|nr:hypothetical protein HMI56_003484 [Coelomomyces lativittatus]
MYHNIRYLDSEKKKKCILPCTPLAIIKILEHLHLYNPLLPNGALYGKQVVIVNRSEVVGRPLAALLANDGAKVYSVDISDILEMHRGQGLTHQHHVVKETSISLDQALGLADIVISGVPSKEFRIEASKLKEGVVAINFSTFPNFNEEDIRSKASFYVSSVGKVTITMLQRNLIRLYNNQKL